MEDLESRLQRMLELLYRIEDTPPVESFRVCESFFAALGLEGSREALLVHDDGEYTNLALFLSKPIRSGAARFVCGLHESGLSEPRFSRFRSSLDAFCAALEGVSHFVYFTFAGDARPVSRLELELQAEIDKFLVMRSVVGADAEEMLEALFARFELRDGLDASEQERYLVANRAAKRYARWSARAFAQGRGEQAMADARRLYRMPMSEKLSHIARAA